jgi:hypothetical protein
VQRQLLALRPQLQPAALLAHPTDADKQVLAEFFSVRGSIYDP